METKQKIGCAFFATLFTDVEIIQMKQQNISDSGLTKPSIKIILLRFANLY